MRQTDHASHNVTSTGPTSQPSRTLLNFGLFALVSLAAASVVVALNSPEHEPVDHWPQRDGLTQTDASGGYKPMVNPKVRLMRSAHGNTPMLTVDETI